MLVEFVKSLVAVGRACGKPRTRLFRGVGFLDGIHAMI